MATDWNLLGAITERISQLTERADAAAAAGDLDLAAYLREQGKQADEISFSPCLRASLVASASTRTK